MSGFAKFKEARRVYANALPEWMDDYEKTGRMHNDPYLMDWDFSPIESMVWGDIRDMCLPFYPQMPVLNYFLDFGCPFLKIGIECDGKAWHDKEKDKARDARLASAGWMIFRIEGHECKRTVQTYRDGSDDDEIDWPTYYSLTSEGLLRAIKCKYFDGLPREGYEWRMEQTLFNHRSTPETWPAQYGNDQHGKGPQLIGDMMGEYLDLLHRRMNRGEQEPNTSP